jgi:hypothetical protein
MMMKLKLAMRLKKEELSSQIAESLSMNIKVEVVVV